MDFVIGAVMVLVGGFAAFTVARVLFGVMVPGAGWLWVALVALLAVGNMFLHKWLGSSINPPFFTAVLFALTLTGQGQGPSSLGAEAWYKRATFAVVIGSLLGWVAYIEVV